MSTDLDNFAGLSSALTGIPQSFIAPQVDPVGLPTQFLAFVGPRITISVLQGLLTQYATLAADKVPPDQIAQAILMNGTQPATTQAAQAARAIMKLWLLGVWYQPYDVDKVAKTGDQTVVSDQAYTNSWAWKIAQAHPMGYSEFFFGYWNSEPPSLEDFTGVPASGQQGASS
ncbi:sorbitol dehydrogenase [Pseudomonas botevensis]|uniref:sorbitol dehydrogenase n=1 Tax=Pseudomonas botevensis TaxID=2842352 RepID=UPI001C3C80B1|nr:sorbitol dehydrogenase [Pseudomonas botevensis]MBV4476593.1 sorbitol dehydrogenase [Pseudomonas botevensis]